MFLVPQGGRRAKDRRETRISQVERPTKTVESCVMRARSSEEFRNMQWEQGLGVQNTCWPNSDLNTWNFHPQATVMRLRFGTKEKIAILLVTCSKASTMQDSSEKREQTAQRRAGVTSRCSERKHGQSLLIWDRFISFKGPIPRKFTLPLCLYPVSEHLKKSPSFTLFAISVRKSVC